MEGQKTVYAYTSLLFILDYPQFSRFFIALGAHHIHNAPRCVAVVRWFLSILFTRR